MEERYVIRRQDKPDSFEEWDDDRGDWGPEGSFPFYHRSEAERALCNVPAKYRPVIVPVIPEDDDDHVESGDEHTG